MRSFIPTGLLFLPAAAGLMAGCGPSEEEIQKLVDARVGSLQQRLEVEKVMAEDPDSLAYHKAAKNVLRKTAPGAKGGAKRVKGEAAPQPVV